VLLLRGDLLARFPGTTIFCVRARWAFRPDGTAYREPLPISAGTVELPLFGCRLDPDIAFCGFNIDLATAQGQIPAASQRPAGVFVVFQEQPVESRFGIAGDVGGDPATRPLASWRDLGAPLVSTVGGRIAGTPPRPVGYLDLAATSASTPFREAVEGLRPAWDARSDSLAAILLAPPFRLYLHATDLVGEPSPTPGPFP